MKFASSSRLGSGEALRPAAAVPERRRHPRAQLSLPVRLRWPTPLGQFTDVTETLDVCRSGLRIHRREPCQAGATLWVTLPFDSTLPLAQPETPARVAWVKETPAGGLLVGIECEASSRLAVGAAPSVERRRQKRVRLALPIQVRPAGAPWPEQTMTVDIAEEGVLFSTVRLYWVGDSVHVTLPSGAIPSRWATGTGAELPARVVRITQRPGSVDQEVAVALLPAFAHRG